MGPLHGHQGCKGAIGVLGAGRESRYSGARRGIGAIRGTGAPNGCWGHWGVSGGIRDVGVSGYIEGPTGSVGTQGPEEV